MNNFNVISDFPETYIYNKYNLSDKEENKKIEVDIDQVAYDLLQCSNDRKKFERLMERLENEFMGIEKPVPDSDNYRKKKEKKSTDTNNQKSEESFYDNQNFNKKNTILSESSNIGNYNQKTAKSNFQNYNQQNYKNSSGSKFLNDSHHKSFDQHLGMGDTINNNNNFHQNNKQNEFMQGTHHKKYTDVHANTKFYYPTDYYNSYEENDLYVEPSQWTNRANTRTLYSHNKHINEVDDYSHSLNRSNLPNFENKFEKNYHDKSSNNYYGNPSVNSTFGNSFYGGMSGKFYKDNTNSAILNKQVQRNGTGNSFGIFYPSNQDF
jgi:hypothetical protein